MTIRNSSNTIEFMEILTGVVFSVLFSLHITIEGGIGFSFDQASNLKIKWMPHIYGEPDHQVSIDGYDIGLVELRYLPLFLTARYISSFYPLEVRPVDIFYDSPVTLYQDECQDLIICHSAGKWSINDNGNKLENMTSQEFVKYLERM